MGICTTCIDLIPLFTGRRIWGEEDTSLLVSLRSSLDEAFNSNITPTHLLWYNVSNQIQEHTGEETLPIDCASKWTRLKKQWANNSNSFEFQKEFDNIYKSRTRTIEIKPLSKLLRKTEEVADVMNGTRKTRDPEVKLLFRKPALSPTASDEGDADIGDLINALQERWVEEDRQHRQDEMKADKRHTELMAILSEISVTLKGRQTQPF